jgi:hypothetical protein
MMDEEVTSAASAWIDIIAQCLRTGSEFRPQDYMSVR